MPAPAAPAGPGLPLDTPRHGKPARRLPPEVLGPEEVLAMLGRCGERCSTGLRNRALITAMYRGGLRISEALDLLPKDVDLQQGLVRVLHGKGDRSRTVGLDPGACAVIGAWAERRRHLGLVDRQL